MQRVVEWLCPSGFSPPKGMLGRLLCRARHRLSDGEKKKAYAGPSAAQLRRLQRLTKAEDAPRPLQSPPRHVGRDWTISVLYWRGLVNVKGRSLIVSLSYVSILRCGWSMDVGRCSLAYACPYTWIHNIIPAVSRVSIHQNTFPHFHHLYSMFLQGYIISQ